MHYQYIRMEELEIRRRIGTIQPTAFLISARILSRVLETIVVFVSWVFFFFPKSISTFVNETLLLSQDI